MSNAVIAGYARTPFHFARKGKLASVSAYPEGEQGSNVGRIAALLAGFPDTVGGATINRFCGSSMTAVHYAARHGRHGVSADRRSRCRPGLFRGVRPRSRPRCARANRGAAVAGVAPEIMGMGPVPATRKALARSGLTIDDIDVVELNEAFASQAVACMRDLGIPPERTNIDGGAIALGHPLGATGARIVGKAAQILKREGQRFALATQCIGGGQGIAIVLEAA
jgi:acetyl-CoA acetyltransferase